ncbi:MAG: hypothetical protein ED559_00395 [Phycisphaera sp.]|nr:MAG: hypothetical protein ED559_00395 [Phycisphaera sp.]
MSTAEFTTPTCPHCSYSLNGLLETENCPECGRRTNYTYPDKPLGPQTICPTCGYCLVGLKAGDNCPECGTPCREAIIEFSVYHAGPAYVNRLASGASLILIAAYLIVFAIIAMVGAVLFMGQLGVLAGGNGPMVGMALGLLVYVALFLASGIVWLIGWIRATTPDPNYLHLAPTSSARGLTRGMAIAVFCLWVCNIIPFVSTLASLANLVCIPIFIFAACAYIKKLAVRIPDGKLAKTASAVRIVFTVLVPIMGISFLGMIVAAAGALSTQASSSSIAAFGALGIIVTLLSGLLMLLAYLRLVSRFAKSMKIAKQRVTDLPSFQQHSQ